MKCYLGGVKEISWCVWASLQRFLPLAHLGNVRRAKRTRRKYLHAAGTPPFIQRIFPPWHLMECQEVSCVHWGWSWAATVGYGWDKNVRPGSGFCWMILLALGRRNLLRRWFCLDSTTFLSPSSFRKSKNGGKQRLWLILSSYFLFLGGNKVILFLSISETTFFNAKLQRWKGTTVAKHRNTPAGCGHQNTEKWLEV